MQNAKRDKPVLELNLGLAFIHAQLTGNVLIVSQSGAVVGSKALFKLEKLTRG